MTILIWPFLEELFYRGLMFEHLSRNLGVILAMLITSAFFTVQHLPHQGWQISHIFFSIGMCVLYLIFKNLLLQISFHSLSNTIHIVKNIPDMATYATVISICFVIVLMIIGIARGKHPYDIEDRIVPGWGKVP